MRARNSLLLFAICHLLFAIPSATSAQSTNKQHSAFYPEEVLQKIRTNLKHDPNGKAFLDRATHDAAYWHSKTDADLRDLIFSPGITRSWMVWSDGYCPSCKKPVRMYDWKIDAQHHPWKLHCPNCGEVFPKNDFYAYYKSGLDEKGWFNQKRANRDLLFNTEHPDPKDPRHLFGVDDGEGYIADGHRWRFMGAYEIYGQFKQLIFNGSKALARAYVLTGDETYAHQCGVLLDRLADFYPGFDYATQGLTYEHPGNSGYISVWHDACEETRELALAYDQIFEGFNDPAMRNNIETGLLRHPLAHPERVHSNFPRAPMTLATLKTVLAWPDNRKEVEAMIDQFVQPATAVDGVTGEKGLSGYTSFTIDGLSHFLEQYCRADSTFLHEAIKRNPALTNTWRFHIDTLCLDQYYPRSGDCGAFGQPTRRYVGTTLDKSQVDLLAPSMFSFFWRLYEETHDHAYVQIIYRENDHSLKNLPHDLFAENPAQFQESVKKVIAKHGAEIKLGSINKEAWHMAILRSGKGKNARALWLDYDSGGPHAHMDGMTIGLFAHSLDLLPDFGYPPVQFGGWTTPRAQWYTMTAAHNTVLVDQNQRTAAGKTTMWADGEMFHAIRADGPAMVGGKQYERTAALIDIDEKNFYVIDIFRTVAGSGHYKFVYGPYGTLTTSNIDMKHSDKDLITGGQLRNFALATNPPTGWSVDWNIDDRFHQLPPKTNLKMRYTDLSQGVDVITNEAWTATMTQLEQRRDGGENWIPCLITRKAGAAPLSSTFVSVLEPFERHSAIKRISRLPLHEFLDKPASEGDIGLCIEFNSGDRDYIIAADSSNGKHLVVDNCLSFNGSFCVARADHKDNLKYAACYHFSTLQFRDRMIAVRSEDQDFVEIDMTHRKVLHGNPKAIRFGQMICDQ
ncbi:MAG: heparinase II/III domain-containing protein [Limisphaerales bacterium]